MLLGVGGKPVRKEDAMKRNKSMSIAITWLWADYQENHYLSYSTVCSFSLMSSYWACMCLIFIGQMLLLSLFFYLAFQNNASLGPRQGHFASGPPLAGPLHLREWRQPGAHRAYGEKGWV